MIYYLCCSQTLFDSNRKLDTFRWYGWIISQNVEFVVCKILTWSRWIIYYVTLKSQLKTNLSIKQNFEVPAPSVKIYYSPCSVPQNTKTYKLVRFGHKRNDFFFYFLEHWKNVLNTTHRIQVLYEDLNFVYFVY